jgi:hypothetical protein
VEIVALGANIVNGGAHKSFAFTVTLKVLRASKSRTFSYNEVGKAFDLAELLLLFYQASAMLLILAELGRSVAKIFALTMNSARR